MPVRLVRSAQSRSCGLQEEVVPFVLENLGCAGNESSLLDCPASDYLEYERDYSPIGSRGRFRDSYYNDACDPYSATYAKVACGMSASAGVPCSKPRSHCMPDIYPPLASSICQAIAD